MRWWMGYKNLSKLSDRKSRFDRKKLDKKRRIEFSMESIYVFFYSFFKICT
tara:strand:- start:48818 stop:48970 length:153 start_codon:yes stop_codon:yes gene_type:complete